MLVVDEFSFASADTTDEIERKVSYLSGNRRDVPFGNKNVVFCGDLRQLEPVAKVDRIYDRPERFLHFLTCYIKLKGMHRFNFRNYQSMNVITKTNDGHELWLGDYGAATDFNLLQQKKIKHGMKRITDFSAHGCSWLTYRLSEGTQY